MAHQESSELVNTATRDCPIWKTLTLGTGPTTESFLTALKKEKYGVSNWAEDLIRPPAFTLCPTETTANLVRVTVAELGFPKGTIHKEIYARAKEIGFSFCPPEVGPTLRLAYIDQPKHGWLLIGMEPITRADGCPYVFCVGRRGGGSWLFVERGYPNFFSRGRDHWVFRLGK